MGPMYNLPKRRCAEAPTRRTAIFDQLITRRVNSAELAHQVHEKSRFLRKSLNRAGKYYIWSKLCEVRRVAATLDSINEGVN